MITHVVGTRPNFPKCSPVHRALARAGFSQQVIHSGQHYDFSMSQQIIQDTGCPIDSFCMDFSGSRLVMVYGDCNTAREAALLAQQGGIPIAHVEAGLRCGDSMMVEEQNRILIDQVADILYAPSLDAVWNLGREGIPFSKIAFIGNVMADAWHALKHQRTLGEYGIVTMHRPQNVDHSGFMQEFMTSLGNLHYPLIFSKHPRVVLTHVPPNVRAVPAMGYCDFARLLDSARFLITDSGGLQEESTLAGVPCLTMRPSTERPLTITQGTNELATLASLSGQVACILAGEWKQGSTPLYWEGKAAERLTLHLSRHIFPT